MRFRNPVIPGFHPDPSVCRVGEDYYLVTSSFQYFPGVPLFHSRDLVHWRQIGHVLTRREQLPLDNAPSSAGIYAPTIRYYKGTFFMVTTNISGGGNFYVTTEDPEGPWSDPIWIDQEGIDPSLFFDEDEKVYFTSTAPGDNQEGGIFQSELDIEKGERISEPRLIWKGTGGQYPEAPHLFRHNGFYYLMIAEGGTDYGHMVTIARGESPWGPFEACPRNPILTHRSTANPIQNTGHADLVQAHDGSWWLVFLGVRPVNLLWHHLGRETFLAPARWADDGWPVIGDEGSAYLDMEVEGLPLHPWIHEPPRDDFDATKLRPCWNFLRNPRTSGYSLTERPGFLRLHGKHAGLNSTDAVTFLGRRQEHFQCRVSALLDFEPGSAREEAGLTIYMDENHHYDIAVTHLVGRRALITRRRIGSLEAVEHSERIDSGPVELIIEADHNFYTLSYALAGAEPKTLLKAETRYLAKEVAGGFTGVYFGMYATGNGHPCKTPAFFDWFEYEGE